MTKDSYRYGPAETRKRLQKALGAAFGYSFITYPPEMLPSPEEGDDVEIIIDGKAYAPAEAEAHLAKLSEGTRE